MIENGFPQRLRKLRKKKGLSMVHLSQLCGLGDCMVQYYEQGRTGPSAKSLAAIAKELNVSMDYLWFGT